MKSYGVFINAMPMDKMRMKDIRYGLAPWIRIRSMPDDMTKREIMELLSLCGLGIRIELFDDQTYHSLQLLEFSQSPDSWGIDFSEFPENWDGCEPKYSIFTSYRSLLISAYYRYGEYAVRNTYREYARHAA